MAKRSLYEKSKEVLLIVRNDDIHDLEEIKAIVREAGYIVSDIIIVKRVDTKCYLGRGKLEELRKIIKNNGITKICVYDELKPRHFTCLMKELGVEVLDKVMVILEIFSQHAGSKEAQLQIELAKLRHELPLVRDWLRRVKLRELPGFLSAGEYAIDAYYRHIRMRMAKIVRELEELRLRRERERKRRKEIGFPHIAIAGYTNSGKTTLFNALTNLNKPTGTEMFTTLSAKTYAIRLCGETIAFVDTVGFIKKIPVDIIEAFKAVLEEISDADLILLVLDASEQIDQVIAKLESSLSILRKIGAIGKPLIIALNKIDLLEEKDIEHRVMEVRKLLENNECNVVDVIPISALKRINLHLLKESICRAVKRLQKTSSLQCMY